MVSVSDERIEEICADALAVANGDLVRALAVLARTLAQAESMLNSVAPGASMGLLRKTGFDVFGIDGGCNGGLRFVHRA